MIMGACLSRREKSKDDDGKDVQDTGLRSVSARAFRFLTSYS